MIIILLPIIFPICAVWLCAWLQVNIISYETNWLGFTDKVGFMQTPYGIALIITIVIIELALIKFVYD